MSRPLARRAVTTGSLGAVATGSRAAAAIGMAALLEGGNAFDAAVAAALAETVALPSKCGLAGDVVALYRRASDDAPTSMIALGGAAAGLHDAAAARGWDVPATGGLAVGIPGAPAGYDRLAALGVLGRERLAAPARALAERGAVWARVSELLAHEAADLLRRHQPDGCVYAPATGAIPAGAVVRLPGLARLLDAFVADGAALFAGAPGAALVDRVARAGGVITADDLRSVALVEGPASAVPTGLGPLWTTGAPTYGAALAAVLADRHPDDIDPALVRDVLHRQARGELAAATGGPEEGTSTVAATDAAGNTVVLVHSNSFPQFGSGLVVDDYDLVLSNRAGRGFAFAPGHPNAPVPGRQPLTTLHAWATTTADADGAGWLFGATPGGEQQVPWNAQVLRHLLRHGTTDAALGEALVSPRWQLAGAGVDTEGLELGTLTARSCHTLVRWTPDHVTAAADPRWDGAGLAA